MNHRVLSQAKRVEPVTLAGCARCTIAVPGQQRSQHTATHWYWTPASGELLHVSIPLDAEAAALGRSLSGCFGDGPFPFGFPSAFYLTAFFLGPHSILPLDHRRMIVAHRAGIDTYLYDISTREFVPLCGGNHPPTMLYASTPALVPGEAAFYTCRWRLDETGRPDAHPASCEVLRVDVRQRRVGLICTAAAGDFVHQLGLSPDGRFLVLAEMGMYTEGILQILPAGRTPHPERLRPSRLTLIDLQRGNVATMPAPGWCPAHLEFDPDDPRVFFLSCHNIGLHRGANMAFGPGTLFRLRIQDGGISVEAAYTHPRFFRISSHALMRVGGRKVVGVTVFPNAVELIDAIHMQRVARFEFYPDGHELESLPANLVPDLRSPFSLCAVGDDVFIANSPHSFFIVDCRGADGTVLAVPYNTDPEQTVGGHAQLLPAAS